MTILLEDIKQALVTGGLTAGDIFLGQFPSSPDAVIVVLETGGDAPEQVMGGTVVMEKPTVQVIVRNARYEYAAATVTARTVFTILKFAIQQTINSTVYHKIVAIQQPFPIGVDDNERPQISCNYEVWRDTV